MLLCLARQKKEQQKLNEQKNRPEAYAGVSCPNTVRLVGRTHLLRQGTAAAVRKCGSAGCGGSYAVCPPELFRALLRVRQDYQCDALIRDCKDREASVSARTVVTSGPDRGRRQTRKVPQLPVWGQQVYQRKTHTFVGKATDKHRGKRPVAPYWSRRMGKKGGRGCG